MLTVAAAVCRPPRQSRVNCRPKGKAEGTNVSAVVQFQRPPPLPPPTASEAHSDRGEGGGGWVGSGEPWPVSILLEEVACADVAACRLLVKAHSSIIEENAQVVGVQEVLEERLRSAVSLACAQHREAMEGVSRVEEDVVSPGYRLRGAASSSQRVEVRDSAGKGGHDTGGGRRSPIRARSRSCTLGLRGGRTGAQVVEGPRCQGGTPGRTAG